MANLCERTSTLDAREISVRLRPNMTAPGLITEPMSDASDLASPRDGEARAGHEEEERLPEATIRAAPEDFVVEEIPAYAPSGRGEHLFITFKKRGLTTPDAVRRIAAALDVDPRSAGFAGMKDRHAVTTQTASFAFPIARDAEAQAGRVAEEGIEILGAARHDHKLKPGHLIGNRFTLVLRDVPEAAAEASRARLAAIGETGVPNAFGPQRFGRDGDNPARALAWLAGQERGPRDRREQRLLFSAVQSWLFNQVLEQRTRAGTWAIVLPGDIARKHDSGGLFAVPLEGPELADAEARARAGLLSATGPMFGAKMRWPEGEPLALERAVLAASALGEEGRLAAHHKLGEGTRRPLRLPVTEMSIAILEPPASTDLAGRERRRPSIAVHFVLPKGGYATTVLGRAFRLVDASSSSRPLDRGRDEANRAGRQGGPESPEEDREDDPSQPPLEEDSA
jgi:tRNA pseudouridine13 synthase